MAKKASFEIYEGFTKRKKKYLVFSGWRILTVNDIRECTRFFHCARQNLDARCGYIFNNELYLELPDYKTKRGAKEVTVVTYVR